MAHTPRRGEARAAAGPVQGSYLCWLVTSALHVLSGAVSVVFGLGHAERILAEANGPPVSGRFLTAFLIGNAVLTLLVAGMVMLFAVKMRAGRNWARVVLTVFGIVMILVGAPSVVASAGYRFGGQELYSGVDGLVRLSFAVLPILLVLAALVLQWLPGARGHFGRSGVS